MDALHDKLNLRFHRGLQVQPDAYYRCPTSESLDGALRNEIEKSASSIIPVEVVTEFVFASASTVTIPASRQGNLGELGLLPAHVSQSITVESALCRDIEGKARLKTQRAISRSFIDVIQSIDGFRYSERHAHNKDGGDGARFKYVCLDSLQNRDRKSNAKKVKGTRDEAIDPEQLAACRKRGELPTYDCGGAIHIYFSTKRAAINIVYKHNPIHRDVENRPGDNKGGSPLPSTEDVGNSQPVAPQPSNGAPKRKWKRTKKDDIEDTNGYDRGDLDMSTSPGPVKTSTTKKHEKKSIVEPPGSSPNSKKRGAKSSNKARSKKVNVQEP